ncbi:hypothetical protein AWR38_01245 [Idiomarina sp. WRN-38]|nr:hypothetical protein AUR68_01240 [Idiomarina sp. H105]OAE96050.1 hypothetical protein AWR38_01245 [Idiomarina sp. WRN-38]
MNRWRVTSGYLDAALRMAFTVTKGTRRLDHRDQNELEALLAGWVSVDERLPKKGEDVQLFCADTKDQMVGFLVTNGRFQFGTYPLNDEFVGTLICQPSHWKPLAPPPTN